MATKYINARHFNPRSPSGLRQWRLTAYWILKLFQSTQPEWAATTCAEKFFTNTSDFNPRSPSGLRQQRRKTGNAPVRDFNPRSPSGLRQNALAVNTLVAKHFNPRSPSGLRQVCRSASCCFLRIFQSTQPEWAATRGQAPHFGYRLVISIHAARVGCDSGKLFQSKALWISIHAARVGCDFEPL